MPPTWAEVSRQLGWRSVSPYHPRASIIAAGFYMRRMRNAWIWDRPEEDRRRLALASYNAGLGSILKAQSLCGKPVLWDAIRPCLAWVTGSNAVETIQYVERIEATQPLIEGVQP